MPLVTSYKNMQRLLDIPVVYDLSQALVGGSRARSIYINEYARPRENDGVLDIGCGTGNVFQFLPSVRYVGFDMNPEYIKSAKKHFGNQGTFICAKVSKDAVKGTGPFDIVLACGILHHLDDNGALELFKLARQGGADTFNRRNR